MIKAIAIDLDDTLLDTSGILAPQATRDAFNCLIENGLKLSLAECEAMRVELVKSLSHRDVFEKLANEYGTDQTRASVKQVIELFYSPILPDTLPLLEKARENIDYLKAKYSLYLVTAGTEISQLRKARALGIEKDFKKIFVVNSILKKRKKDAFLEILKLEGIEAEQLLCIGNSISSEMKDAMAINAVTCYFEFGEDRGHLSDLPRAPHFRIHNHADLIPTCRL
jgi:putative hydrolase of the HAD superfamily